MEMESGLPPEIYEQILLRTQTKDLPRICAVNSQLYSLCSTKPFWREKFKERGIPFPPPVEGKNFPQWMASYLAAEEGAVFFSRGGAEIRVPLDSLPERFRRFLESVLGESNPTVYPEAVRRNKTLERLSPKDHIDFFLSKVGDVYQVGFSDSLGLRFPPHVWKERIDYSLAYLFVFYYNYDKFLPLVSPRPRSRVRRNIP